MNKQGCATLAGVIFREESEFGLEECGMATLERWEFRGGDSLTRECVPGRWESCCGLLLGRIAAARILGSSGGGVNL